MSHEGIRKNPEEIESKNSRSLPRIAITPAKVRVLLTEGTGMEIDWVDGHRSAWNFAWLREACPCATCVEKRHQEGRKPGQPGTKPAALLPIYTLPSKPIGVHAVGHYAIQFDWFDGHSGGLYSWNYLRRLCQCPECVAAAQEAVSASN
jgi:DUF971 family protein